MDTKIFRRLEAIGAILEKKRDERVIDLECYLKTYHEKCWELGVAMRSQTPKFKNSQDSYAGKLEQWLETHDVAWKRAIAIARNWDSNFNDWEALGQKIECSSETTRQSAQAMMRGGWDSN